MKTSIIRSSWLPKGGFRLDCSPYLGGALETEILLEKLSVRKDPLGSVTKAIYHAGRESRQWVDDPEFGIPFIGSSDLQKADLSDLPLIAKSQVARNPQFLIHKGYTLITRSGTIGKMAYCRPAMDGLACSEHVLRVVPDETAIPPGYLYAFLSSRFGVPLVVAGTYGSIIQSIEPAHITGLSVPRFGEAQEQEIHDLIEGAARLRSEHQAEIESACERVAAEINLRLLQRKNVRGYGINTIQSSKLDWRLDALYHSVAAHEADTALAQCTASVRCLSEVTKRLFKPPMFKRMWVSDPAQGAQFISGIDAYNFEADEKRFVSRLTPNFKEFILENGWVIFQAAGQIYGLFARPLYVHGWLEGVFAADDLYRIVHNSPEDGGYLFAFFRTDVGEVLIKRQSAGNSIPRVWDPQMNKLQVPWPDEGFRKEIGTAVIQAHQKARIALNNSSRAVALIEAAIEKFK